MIRSKQAGPAGTAIEHDASRTAPAHDPAGATPAHDPAGTASLATPEKRAWSYMPGLDGLRAVAVLAVMAYHGGMGWAGGGFLGVDAFFVLSGFLITSLLLDEWRRTGTIALRAFWLRRARRLLPALLLLVGGVAVYAAMLAPPGTLGTIRTDGLATLGYVANWHQISAHQGYFAQGAPLSPWLHTWSLAIEEQFYVVWPLVMVLVLRRWRRPGAVLVVAVASAVASALEMGLLFHAGGDPSRVYYGTDTRAQTILIGAALAVVLARPSAPVAPARHQSQLWGLLAAAGAAGFAWLVVAAGGASPTLYHGGFVLCGLFVAAVIAGVARAPGCPTTRLLCQPWLRYVGRISYGLYLWHWPVFLALDHARTGLTGVALLALRVVATFALAVPSYHLVELPVRAGALRRLRPRVLTPVAVAAAAVTVVTATITVTPEPTLADITAAPQQAPAAASTGASGVRVLLEGDSVASTLGFGWQPLAPSYGIDLWNRGVIGCGLATAGQVLLEGVVRSDAHGILGIPCAQWPARWTQDVARFRPQVAAVLVGPWEVRDRLLGGSWTYLGQPAFDTYELAQLREGARILASRGAHVVLLTSPYYDQGESPAGWPWPEDDPTRVDLLNVLLEQVAQSDPGQVSVLALGALLSPGGHYAADVGGQALRYSDGVHITPAGARYLAPWLLPKLAALGQGSTG